MAELPTPEDFKKLYAVNGVFGIRQMFIELSRLDKREMYPPVFTLKPFEHKGLPSAYQVYMESVDEYDAATKLVPNMKIWDSLLASSWFVDGDPQHSFEGIAVWREHMKLRDASLAKAALFNKIKDGDVTASKAILAETKTKAKVGKKSKADKQSDATVARMKDYRKKS